MKTLFVVLAVSAVAGMTGMLAAGLHPVMPWRFAIGVALLLPIAWTVTSGLAWLEPRLRGAAVPLVGLGVGGILLSMSLWGDRAQQLVQLACFAAFVARVLGGRPTPAQREATQGMVVLLTGIVALWCAHYLALLATRGRLLDHVARAIDMAAYGIVDYRGLFPLVTNRLASASMAQAYVFQQAEIALVLWAVAGTADRARVYLARLFAANLLALAVFMVVPIVGPCLAYPDSIRASVDGTIVGSIIRGGQVEFDAIRSGGQPVTGFGYFVALPSLHVVMAVLFQWTVRHTRLIFWALLPINVLIIAATVVFGFHYLIDVAGGILTAALVIALIRERQETRVAGDPAVARVS
ncbi:MAG: phosphatase PAP2 family protein [Vicinamibacterales bacterium]